MAGGTRPPASLLTISVPAGKIAANSNTVLNIPGHEPGCHHTSPRKSWWQLSRTSIRLPTCLEWEGRSVWPAAASVLGDTDAATAGLFISANGRGRSGGGPADVPGRRVQQPLHVSLTIGAQAEAVARVPRPGVVGEGDPVGHAPAPDHEEQVHDAGGGKHESDARVAVQPVDGVRNPGGEGRACRAPDGGPLHGVPGHSQLVGPSVRDPPGKPDQPALLLVAPGRVSRRFLPRLIHVRPSPATAKRAARPP